MTQYRVLLEVLNLSQSEMAELLVYLNEAPYFDQEEDTLIFTEEKEK